MAELHEAKLDRVKGAYLGTGLSLTEMDLKLQEYGKQLKGGSHFDNCKV